MAGGGGGGATKTAVARVDFFHIFSIKTEFWIVGVVGGGQRRNAISKKISNQKRSHT
jgi:hypothetical protein